MARILYKRASQRKSQRDNPRFAHAEGGHGGSPHGLLGPALLYPFAGGEAQVHFPGRANTSRALPEFGRRISGASSGGIRVDQLPPPMPAGIATYCFPFARYVIGNP